ncbi:MAG: hypothetical protein QNJ33_01770 [Crocosphaera sp.]|nr:hypothetical protein [Crocosphaera sp.]
MSDATQLTADEIQQYREQLKDNPEAIAQLEIIKKCDGDLQYATIRLARRSNIDEVRTIVRGENEENFWQKVKAKARIVVCRDGIQDDLAPNILGGLVGLFATCGDPLLAVVATPLAIHIIKETLEDFCKF